jgi:hypothetical protein
MDEAIQLAPIAKQNGKVDRLLIVKIRRAGIGGKASEQSFK